MHVQVSQDSLFEKETTGCIFMVLAESDKKTDDLKTGQMYGQICGSTCLMHRKAKRGKSRQSRNHAWIMPEDYVVFSLLIPTMTNSSVQ